VIDTARRSRFNPAVHLTIRAMTPNRLANICAAIIAAWAFAMIGIEGAAHHQPTHSGTQEYVKHDHD